MFDEESREVMREISERRLFQKRYDGDVRRARKFRANNPDNSRKNHLRRRYNMTVADKDEMFASQGNVCAGCGGSDPRRKTGWVIDHCHSTNKVRGILCHPCNVILGMAKDNSDTLQKLIDYLQR